MIWQLISLIDILLFVVCLFTIGYLLVFALASTKRETAWASNRIRKSGRFLFITTVTDQDTQVERTIKSILNQDYDSRNFDLIVVGDQLAPLTSMKLAQYPVTFFNTRLGKGASKLRALQYAADNMSPLKIYDLVILIDPDETVGTAFLNKVNAAYQSGYKMMQFHRTDLNRKNSSRVLATTFDEINNSIFRVGHNNLGLSSALIGSSFAMPYAWFKDNIARLSDENEEKEMEVVLLQQHRYIDYMEQIYVFVEHTSDVRQFANQRRRWRLAQASLLRKHAKLFLPALVRGNYDLADKLLQWMLLPRTILVVIVFGMCVLTPLLYWTLAIKWWVSALVLLFAYALATPDYLVDDNWTRAFWKAPMLMLSSVLSPLLHRRR